MMIFRGSRFKIRMGEWDTSKRDEPLPNMEFDVQRIFTHPQYTSINLQNNIAVMRLAT